MGFLSTALKPAQKAVIGAGAYAMEFGTPLWTKDKGETKFIREALGIYHTSRHIRRAEMTIANRIGGVPWHLEDAEGNEISDDSPDIERVVRDLIEKPTGGARLGNQPVTRREMWQITGRHMGLVNVAFWYRDGMNRMTGLPERFLYIRPDRMTPSVEKSSNKLTGWILDYDSAKGSGTPLALEEVLTFYLEVPDEGFYGSGLVEAALALAQKVRISDQHEVGVYGSGGRLPGIISPKVDAAVSDDVYDRLVKDWRTVVEMPDAAKRTIIARAPIDFTPTAQDMKALLSAEMSRLTQEQTFGLWGVPPETTGYTPPGGLGDSRKAPEAALWQNAVQPRVDTLYEVLQYQFLDGLKNAGVNLQLVIESPTFDDEQPKFDMALAALNQPLSVDERREILGLPPIGDEFGRTILLPNTLVPVGATPEEVNPAAKASLSADKMRSALERDIAKFLARQKQEIVARVRQKAEHLMRRQGKDDQAWFDAERWDAELAKVLQPYARQLANATATKVEQRMAGKADFGDLVGNRVLQRLLSAAGKRIKGINETTREHVANLLRQGVEAGEGAAELGDRIEAATFFDEYRAEMIARTETATVLNQAATESYREFGVEEVRVIDGDQDEECAAADGQTWTLDEANDKPIGHPNCVRDFIPVVGELARGIG